MLAPHMDDEVIGPGGTLRRHVEAGAAVTVVFLTDGRMGGYDDGTLSRRRKEESRQAAELLGFGDLLFLDAPDGKLRDEPRLVAGVARLSRSGSRRWSTPRPSPTGTPTTGVPTASSMPP